MWLSFVIATPRAPREQVALPEKLPSGYSDSQRDAINSLAMRGLTGE